MSVRIFVLYGGFQQTRDVIVAEESCGVERRAAGKILAVLALDRRIRSSREEHFDNPRVSFSCRHSQRSGRIAAAVIYPRLVFQQEFDDFDMSPVGGGLQRGIEVNRLE